MAETCIEQLHKIYLKNRSVSIDTRTLKKGDIFFALKGPNFDGNKYAALALDSGAEVVVVDDSELKGVKLGDDRYILVTDTLISLQSLATFHRNYSKVKVIGITGSNGKTTTKELVATVLTQQYEIIYTQGNLNNHIGVPLTLLTIRENTEIAIVEMGANHQGEIAELSEIAKPDFGLITNIGYAHIEGFGSFEGVKTGKGELFQAIMKSRGHLFVNESDQILVALADNYQSITNYSRQNSFDGTIIEVSEREGSLELTFQWNGKTMEQRLHLYGAYNVPNILAALNIGYYFKVSPAKALEAISNYLPENSRSQRLKTESNEIYLDAYNANPTSMEHALKAFANVDAKRKVVILGDMFELGDEALNMHQKISDLADELFDHSILVGENFSKILSSQLKFDTTEALKTYIDKNRFNEATILLKGSRGMALETLIDCL